MEKTLQKTLAQAVTFEGVALHSGDPVVMVVEPAPKDTGIVFHRTDLGQEGPDACLIPGRYDHVIPKPFCTLVANEKGHGVSTIEHVMAALAALDIYHVHIKVSGAEVPVMDGSSQAFLHGFLNAGIKTLEAPQKKLVVLKEVRVEKPWGYVALTPHAERTFEVTTTFANRPDMPPQHLEMTLTSEAFHQDIASARTFGFFEDVEALRQAGFAKGGSLENAVVMKEGKVMNPQGLRFPDECVRHKILDALGDLSLAGLPISGKYTALNGGHEMNNALLRHLFDDKDAYKIEIA